MSFFRTLIYFILGDLGRALLNFYQENDVWINSLALVYGLVLIYAHQNLRKLVHQIDADILELAGPDPGSAKYSDLALRLSKRWADKYADERIFIPTRTDLWLKKIDKAGALELLHIQGEYIKLALHKLTGIPARKSFSINTYRVWDEYRHRLLTGIRSRIKDPQEILKQLEEQDKRAKANKK